ncbi:hypothetical protein AMTR_s00055p00226960 [Amborella trichopoda]|uniref:Uncharacterized protein n=1 Tax=Amborella trichopoda TaxID=13333 RepID=U5DAD3_AMBTC|nr:hypothetical protein AMTR_s00055p00226960 [Amborella trichopoda]
MEKAIVFDFNLTLPIIAIKGGKRGGSCSRDERDEGRDIRGPESDEDGGDCGFEGEDGRGRRR